MRVQLILTNHEFGNATGFSSYLEAFARQHVDGTWLTRVSITGGGTVLGLEGKTLSSELVPIYIQQLAEEKTLSGSSFNVMELHRSKEEEAHQLVFKISTN
ncbi:MAG: biosis protein MshI [Gammaproteobacteria bacterium]|nr:biosis protein MshI [Gammaproteobacteria bacterium]